MIITIDGPTGSGKTTVARHVANKLGIQHLKGGIFLRSFTYYCLKNKLSTPTEIAEASISFGLRASAGDVGDSGLSLELAGERLEDNQLWNEEVDGFVSYVAGIKKVREARKKWLRELSNGWDLVADGRTLGSEIFPEADHKFILICDLDERARRRVTQGNYSSNFMQVYKQIEARDLEDAKGDVDRTIFSAQGFVIDSTNLSVDEVVKIVCNHVALKE